MSLSLALLALSLPIAASIDRIVSGVPAKVLAHIALPSLALTKETATLS